MKRMHILDSSENDTQHNTAIDSDENFDPDVVAETVSGILQTADGPIVSGGKNIPPVLS